MVAKIELFDAELLRRLIDEFRASMRRLLFDLCEELDGESRRQAAVLQLPVGLFREVADSLAREHYSNWKVVGWIEELNELVYFLDLQAQLHRERSHEQFAMELLAECEEQLYEHSYLDELFPRGEPEPVGLARRLSGLCARLARQATQESLFLVPGLPCVWLARTQQTKWTTPCDLRPNFERAELGGCVYAGVEGAYLAPPASLRTRLSARTDQATLLIRPDGIQLRIGGQIVPLLTPDGLHCSPWQYVPPCYVQPGGLTLGPALVYGKDASPCRVAPPPPGLAERLQRALAVIESAWPAGGGNVACLTSRIVPLKARGVVSFSYRHRPGLSFINCFDRDALDLIDDLLHENSHHHLNLLLRKYVLIRKTHYREVLYSPWRRTLRPLRGILHASFTFTMGAILFERLSAWAGSRTRPGGARSDGRGKAGLTAKEVLRARFRCLEEVESVQYSMRDLTHAANSLGWLSGAGGLLVSELQGQIAGVRRRIAPYRRAILRSRYGAALRRQQRELAAARTTYRPLT
ncbi:MAG: hypothetical protein IH803_01355 [Nitrospirae bacterium]|nr:hypothetical protein [Nitrospirota bacterium]